MRDFEKEVLDAAKFNGIVKSSDFSWSSAREILFRKCRRAYFFRYYLAQGGWDPFSDPLAVSAYREKYVIPFHAWVERTFQSAVRQGLIDAMPQLPEKRKKTFSSSCLRNLTHSVFDLQAAMENKEYVEDPKRPVILECLRDAEPMKLFMSLKQEAVALFSNAFAEFMQTELYQRLPEMNLPDFRLDTVFYSFDFGKYPVWFTPGLLFFLDGRFSMFLYQCGKPEDRQERNSIAAALFSLYIRSKWKKQASAYLLSFTEDGAAFAPISPQPKVQSRIHSTAQEMLSLIRPDGAAHLTDFPCTDDRAQCAGCQFLDTCRGMSVWEKEKSSANVPHG